MIDPFEKRCSGAWYLVANDLIIGQLRPLHLSWRRVRGGAAKGCQHQHEGDTQQPHESIVQLYRTRGKV